MSAPRTLLTLLLLCLLPGAAWSEGQSPPPSAPPSPPRCQTVDKLLASGTASFRDCDGAPEMIALKGGEFRMGDLAGDGQTYEWPAHPVRVGSFALGRFEVTNHEWSVCVAANACSPPSHPIDDQHSRYPVAGVSWNQVQAYVAWLSRITGKAYRLPSEAEWEYAARAGEERRYYWGFEDDACHYGNFLDYTGRRSHPDWYWAEGCDDHYAEAAPVGSFLPNAWGFEDVLGNVWEWVADCWHPNYDGAPADGSAWVETNCNRHVNRGGGWGNNLRASRLSSRDGDRSSAHSDGLGFRVARSVDPTDRLLTAFAAPDSIPHVVKAEVSNQPPATAADLGRPWVPSSPGRASAAARPVAAAPSIPPPVTSLATERVLSVHLSLNGTQSWVKAAQHTQGSTEQDYEFSTRLRSDGTLYADNLLDPDPQVRIAVRTQYVARHGLILLKAANGGHLPNSAEEIDALSARLNAGMAACSAQMSCTDSLMESTAALQTLRDNSTADLERLIERPASGAAARWLYFFGYPDCPVQMHLRSSTHIAGERSRIKRATHGVPWSLDGTAEDSGSADDRAGLCQRYTVTIDVRTGTVFLDNLYIPAPTGTTTRKIRDLVEQTTGQFPVPTEVLAWVNRRLEQTRETAQFDEALPAQAPFDEDYSALGQYTGTLNVKMSWSFLPAEGSPLAVIPGVEEGR